MNRWQQDFARFIKKDRTTPLPPGYDAEYYIYMLCNGKIEQRETVAETYTLHDAIKWNYFRTYDNHVQEELQKLAVEKANRR